MPKSADDVMLILENIFKEATIHEKLKNVIHNMKFKPGIDFSLSKGDMEKQLYKSGTHEIIPIIVIYVNGKNNAQYALDTLYRLFKDVEGLDITPRYNERITVSFTMHKVMVMRRSITRKIMYSQIWKYSCQIMLIQNIPLIIICAILQLIMRSSNIISVLVTSSICETPD